MVAKENEAYIGFLFFFHKESSNSIKYMANMCWSCPYIMILKILY